MTIGTKVAVYDSGKRFIGVIVHVHMEAGKPSFLIQLTNQDMFWYHPKQCRKLLVDIKYKKAKPSEKRVAA